MTIQNGYNHGKWKKALKTGLALSIGLITANFVDPMRDIYSWPWFKHVLIAAVIVFVMHELAFFQNWLNTSNGGNGNDETKSNPVVSVK